MSSNNAGRCRHIKHPHWRQDYAGRNCFTSALVTMARDPTHSRELRDPARGGIKGQGFEKLLQVKQRLQPPSLVWFHLPC